MKHLIFQSRFLILLGFLTIGISQAQAKEGDILAEVSGTGSGYGRQTTTDSHNVGWVTIGQSGYFGINKASNNTGAKAGVNATDLPVAKAVDANATSSTSTSSNSCTGYYTFYTTTSLKNVGSIIFYYSANDGNNKATAYVVMGDVKSASGGAAYTQVPLATTSTSQQGVSLGTSGTFTFTFAQTQTNAKFYGVVIKTSSYKRMTNGKITIKEGASSSKTPLAQVTDLSAGTLTATSATISWTGISDAELDGYKVEYKVKGASAWMVATSKTTETSYTLTGLTPSTEYAYQITSVAKSTSTTKKDSDPKAGTNFTTDAPASREIKWYANNQQVYAKTQQEGAALTIPSDPDATTYCYGKTFVGWTASQNYSDASTAPGDLFTSTDSKTVGSTTAYYAVFADAEGGDEFYIYHNNSGTKTYVGAISGDYLSAHTTKSNAVPYTIDSDGYLSYTVGSTTTYVTHTTSGETKVATGKTKKLTITKTETTIQLRSTVQTTRYLQYSTSGGGRFQFTASSATLSCESAISYSNYTTTCAPVYEATVADGITNGSVVISKTDDISTGVASLQGLKQGDKVYIFPTANKGYNIESVTVNGTPISAQSDKYSYEIETEGITVSATFAAKQTLKITANAPEGGTYTVKVDNQAAITVTSAQTISAYEGAVITMTSEADDTHKLHSKPFLVQFDGEEEFEPSKSGDNYSFTMLNKAVTIKAQYSATYSITAASCTGGSITKITDKNGKEITRTSSGSKVIVELSANTHYHIASVYYIKEGEEKHNEITEDNDVYSFGMVASNITVYAEFEEDTKYIVTFNNNGSESSTKQVYAGDPIGTLPTLSSSDAKDWWSTTFVGWTVEDWDGKKAEYTGLVNANTLATDGMVLNAVWAKEGDVSNKYKKITSTDELEDGNYILAGLYSSKYYAMKNATVSGGFYMDRVEVTPAQDIITTDNANIVWKLTFNTTNKTATFYNEALTSNNYLYAYSTGSGSNKYYDLGMRATAYNFKYSLDANTSGAWQYEASTLSGEYLTYYNNNSSKDYFNLYTQQSNPNYLFKQMPSLTDYITKSTTAPDLVVSPTALSNFSTIATAGPSIAQSFTLQGGNLKGDVTASVGENSDYEISASQESGYAKKITFTPNNKRVSATVYVRLANHTENTAIASASGTVTVATDDAVSKLVALSGKVDAKTLESISVATQPTNRTYTLGEKFNPAGLVIKATYNSGEENVTYAGHESEFTFNPALDAELTASDGSVSVTWGGKSISVTLTLNCSVAWKVNGADWAEGTPTTSVVLNGKLTKLPDDPSEEACDGKVFMGWTSATSVNADGTGITYAEANKTTISANTIFNAVFATASEVVGATYTKVTNVSTLNAGDNIIITDADAGRCMIAYDGSSDYYKTETDFVMNQDKSQITNIGSACEFVLGGSTDNWTLYDGTYYVYAAGTATSGKNYMKGQTTCDDACKWKISISNNVFTVKSVSNTNTPYMRYNYNQGSTPRFTCYNSATQTAVVLYRKPGIQYSDYTITCCPKHEVKNGSMSIGGFTATPAQACADAEVTLVPDEVTGYNFKNFTFATEGGESINPDDIYFMDNEFLMPDYNIVVTANYEVASYSIEYNLNGGEWDGAEGVSSYTYGVGATLPTNVKKEGNNFDGWYLNNEGERITSIAADETGNKSFTARWIPLTTRTITYIGADSHITFAEKPATIDGTATDLTINYTLDNHYKLDGVKVAIGGVELTGELEVIYDNTKLLITPNDGNFADNITITFDIKPIEFTVQWLVNGQEFAKQENVLEGTTYGELTKPESNPADITFESCEANKFMGWATMDWTGIEDQSGFEAVQVTNDYEIIEGQTKLYAVFAKEGTGGVEVGTVLWSEDFSGFSTDDVPSVSNDNTVVYGDASLTYSTVSAGGGTSKIYNENNAGGTAPELLIGKQGASFGCSNIPTAGATKMKFSFNTNQTSNITVTSSTTGITIGTLSISDKVASCEIDNPNKLATFQIQINRTTSSNSREDNILLKVAEAPISYSDFITNCDMSTYRVKFDANAPEGETTTGSIPATAEVNPAEDYTIPAATLTAEHYTQIGWNESKTATTAQTKVEKMDAGLSTTLYAVWKAKKYTIMYVDGGEESSTVEVAYGQSTTVPAMKTSCPDYQQIGWTDVDPSENKWATKPNIVVESNADFVVTDDAILYAVYAEVSGDPTKFELISDISELESGANYIITGLGTSAEYALNNNFTKGSYNNMGATEVEVDDEDIITTTNAAIIWKVTAVADDYTIYNAKANKYLSGNGSDIDFVETNPVAFTLADMNGSAISIYSTALGYTFQYFSYLTENFQTRTNASANYFYKQKFVATYLANPVCKEVNSISVKHAPTKVDYVEGESFNPSGLVITVNYTEGDPEDVAYDDAAIKFSFTPALSEALKQSDKQVTITYGGKICKQTITVAEYVVPTYYLVGNASELVEGDVIVLGCANYDENGTSAVAGEFTDKYFSVQEAEISKGILKSENAVEFILGKDENNWTLSTEGKLVGAIKAKELALGSGTTTWTISFDEKGNALITSSSSGYGTIKFNTDYSNYPRFINYASGGKSIQIYSKRDTRYKRTGLTYDQAGTICLPYAVKADDYTGASVWSIESRTGTGTMISSITLVEEVDEEGNKKDLEAGKPYIFFAEEETFAIFCSGNPVDEVVEANGLIGNLDATPIIINPGQYQPGYYLINQNKLMECGTNCNVPQYRAYVKAYDIQYVVQAPPAAPRRVIGNPSGTPTNLNSLNGNDKAQKALIDGHIYILRDNKMYNAQGLFVK